MKKDIFKIWFLLFFSFNSLLSFSQDFIPSSFGGDNIGSIIVKKPRGNSNYIGSEESLKKFVKSYHTNNCRDWLHI